MTASRSERKAVPALAEAWAHLRHGGLLIAPARLPEFFPAPPAPLPEHIEDSLRGAVTRVQSDNDDPNRVLDVVLERALGLKSEAWVKGTAVDATWTRRSVTGETIKPRRVWLNHNSDPLPVFWADPGEVKRLGVGRGKRATSRVLEWLRGSDQKMALLTNGRQWRVMYAGSDHDAWAEADVDSWFEEGEAAAQLHALRALISPAALTHTAGRPAPLREAIQASRRGQAEVSSVLGERVRRAVELLIRAYAPAIDALQAVDDTRVEPRDLYLAASRIVMRNVVVLFAESREGLLPVDNPVYYQAYSLQGLREQLERMPPHALRDSRSAWPRVLALFNLMREGSPHPALTVPRYGGGLFMRGDPGSPDPVLRALSAFEDTMASPTDDVVSRILRLLTRTKTRVRQGRSSIMVDTPVDFSDLGTEYIGIIYEGLLDFELRKTGVDTPVVFLNLGKQPALPLDRLEAMSNRDLTDLLQKLKKEKAGTDEEEETAEAAPDDGSGEGETEEAEEDDGTEADIDAAADDSDEVEDRDAHERVKAWAKSAVVTAGLIVKRGRRQPDPEQVDAAARALVKQVIPPDRWFLVRWGGTRKGSGTFYTRPALAAPTIRRTLEPLVYERGSGDSLSLRAPEEILRLKVCDPSMGSGSFLAGALRYLTNALYQSLHHHERIKQHGPNTLCRLADGGATNDVLQETLPLPPDHPDFEERLVARLKRHVVERCLYGVDYDPLAVELARVALWIETMDRNLPFEFLDHKLKVGNSLIGAWLDQFHDYPVMAWARDGGDRNHTNFVHHSRLTTRGKPRGDVWTTAIKEKSQAINAEMVQYIASRRGAQTFSFMDTPLVVEDLHREAMKVFERLERVPPFNTEERARVYREEFLGDPDLQRLKLALDTWCSIWFWPADELDVAPTPLTFNRPSPEMMRTVKRLSEQHKFFHWELEFPDAFSGTRAGFDALIGNPPWETLEPNSKEFFSNLDPLYRSYGKSEATSQQTHLFQADPDIERVWVAYLSHFRALSNWLNYAADPTKASADSGLPQSQARSVRPRPLNERPQTQLHQPEVPAAREFPYRHQMGGKAYTYKLFLELSHFLAKTGGRIGLIVPTGIYSDKGSGELRRLFIRECSWDWLFSFENRDKIFDIHRSFKFCALVLTKGGTTQTIRTAFMLRDLLDWENAEEVAYPLSPEAIARMSPATLVVPELRRQEDFRVMEQMARAAHALDYDISQASLAIKSTSQGDVNLSSHRGQVFHEEDMPSKNLHTHPLGLLTDSADRVKAVPIVQGAMFFQHQPFYKAYDSGFGHRTRWADNSEFVFQPQFWGHTREFEGDLLSGLRLVLRRLTNVTNARSIIACALPEMPSSDTTLHLQNPDMSNIEKLVLCAVLNSFAFDWIARMRISGATGATALDLARLAELPVPSLSPEAVNALARYTAQLNLLGPLYSRVWLELRSEGLECAPRPAMTRHERLRLSVILDAVVASSYGLNSEEFAWILRDCDYPRDFYRNRSHRSQLDQKGFWRVDEDQPPELRQTVLTQVAHQELMSIGLERFLQLNNGDGWMLPETLRLADYGLGHDERSTQPQPVATVMGARHYEWQLERDPKALWRQFEMHAYNIQAIMGATQAQPSTDSALVDMFGNDVETDMFGNPLPVRKRK